MYGVRKYPLGDGRVCKYDMIVYWEREDFFEDEREKRGEGRGGGVGKVRGEDGEGR